MAGGSQLAQLKQRIRAEGIDDRRQQSKSAKKRAKRKQAGIDDSPAARAARLAAVVGDNPFESKVTKPKHDVLTLKRANKAGIAGRPGAAKQAALSQRQAQLLPEYQARTKSGSFVDHRFGENDPTLTPEERMLERFTKERQRRSARNSAAFNLGDDDGDPSLELTHYGQSLGGLDDLSDGPLDGEDGEGGLSGNIDNRTTSRTHFGGFEEKDEDQDEDGEDRKKSKAEVMAEIIAKSKLAKHERQKVKDADEDLRHELDAELGDIRGLLFSMPVEGKKEDEEERARKEADKLARYGDPSKSGPNAIPIGGKSNADPTGAQKARTEPVTTPNLKPSADTYDAFVRELAFDRRAKPTDRLKTEAELAAEQAELLQKQERARLKRMRGEPDSDDEDTAAERGKRRRKDGVAQADDLDDDFVLDGETAADVYGLGRGLSDASEEEDAEEDGQEDEELSLDGMVAGDDEEGDSSEDGDSDEYGDDAEDSGSEEAEDDFGDMVDPTALAQPGEDEDDGVKGEHQELVSGRSAASTSAPASKPKKGTDAAASKPGSTLPFTFPCPRNHSEFLALLEEHNVQAADVPTVIKRIRTLYHPSLAEDNKFKLQAVLGVLLDHALYVAGLQSSKTGHATKDGSSGGSGGFDLVNALVPPIFELSKTYPLQAAQHFVAKLTLMQRNLQRGLAAGALLPTSRTWPRSGGELALLRIAGAVWPTSDWQHPVPTPRALLMAQYLAHARIRCTGDVACALYLCTLVADGERLSRRIVPEALNALGHAMVLLGREAIGATEEGWRRVQEAQVRWGLPMPDVGAGHTALVGIALPEEDDAATEAAPHAFSLPSLLSLGPNEDAKEPATAQAAAEQLLHSTFVLVGRFAKLYEGSPAFCELFEPFLALLSAFPAEGAALSTRCGHAMLKLTQDLRRQVANAASSRRALRLQAHRAVSLATYVPKFDQEGRGGASRLRGGVFDPDPDRVERSKLRAQLKQERKGALRELRRDNAFLAQVRDEERREEDREYKRRMDKIVSGLQEERKEEKALQREKARIKKRAGRK